MGENHLRVFHIQVKDDVRRLLNAVFPVVDRRVITAEGIQADYGGREEGSRKTICDLIGRMQLPLTVFCESDYVDSTYRDTYYRYYSSQHFDIPRNCLRFSFFRSIYRPEDLIGRRSSDKLQKLQDDFIGIVVVRPVGMERIGKVLLDPSKMKLDGSVFIRTTKFSVEIMGNLLDIDAFPFMKQDIEFMTCAEVTLWEVFQYYGTRYPEYRTVLPSEISDSLDSIKSERVLPSRGMHFSEKTSILKSFGFQPRSLERERFRWLRETIHYYVESGIPVLLTQDRHAIVCIGHAAPDFSVEFRFKDMQAILDEGDGSSGKAERFDPIIAGIPAVDSGRFFSDYVIMDDGRLPYTVLPYEGCGEAINPTAAVVPLYRRINLDAMSARVMALRFLGEVIKEGDLIDASRFDESNPLVYRIQLTTSRKYQSFRSNHEGPEASAYLIPTYPKFIWLCEISSLDLYKRDEVLGEVVIDATASHSNNLDAIILFRYGRRATCRKGTDGSFRDALSHFNDISEDECSYPMYKNNLRKV